MKLHLSRIPFLTLLAIICVACQPATPNPSNPPKVLFQDTFFDTASGWTQGEDDIGSVEYKNGGLQISVKTDLAVKISLLELQPFTDTRIEVDTLKTGGPDDNDFGIVCRYVDESNFYFFEISSDGYYGIGKYRNNQLELISARQMQSSDAINQGKALNHLRADCVGSSLALYANGKKLAEVSDQDLKSGNAGLIAGTFHTPGTEVLFDNISILKP